MPDPSRDRLQDLKKKEIDLLAQQLFLQEGLRPTEAWLHDQAKIIANFPPSLLRPTSFILRLGSYLTKESHLCKIHKALNAHLIHDIFLQVSAECTTHVIRLLEYPEIPETVSEFVKRLQSLNSLWMPPDLYRQAFTVQPEETRLEAIAGGCEACVLAIIGGNREVISDLRTSILGRKKKHRPSPGLTSLVESWIEWTGRDREICKESDSLTREVRRIRRALQQARRQLGHKTANRTRDELIMDRSSGDIEAHDEDDTTEHDGEISIIGYYANLTSVAGVKDPESVHPAFKDLIVFDRAAGTF